MEQADDDERVRVTPHCATSRIWSRSSPVPGAAVPPWKFGWGLLLRQPHLPTAFPIPSNGR
jgi:hypothetical protein